jgi:hypothetical protein
MLLSSTEVESACEGEDLHFFGLLCAVAPAAYADNWSGLANFVDTLAQWTALVLLISALWHIPRLLERRSISMVIPVLLVVGTFPVAALAGFLLADVISDFREWNGMFILLSLCVMLWLSHIGMLTLLVIRKRAARALARQDVAAPLSAKRIEVPASANRPRTGQGQV